MMVLFAIVVWKTPSFVTDQILNTPLPEDSSTPAPPVDVEEILEEMDIPSPLNEDNYNDVRYATFVDIKPEIIAKRIQKRLREQGIESYVLSVDGLDADLYIYQNEILTHRYLFIQSLKSNITVSMGLDKIDQPQIAIVIGGIGEKQEPLLIKHPQPLNLAIVPTKPFSLTLAEEGALHWHEILVDARPHRHRLTPFSLPFASGVLSKKKLSYIPPFFVNLFPSTGALYKKANYLPLQFRYHTDMYFLLQRTKQLAIDNGNAAILVEHDDPELPYLLAWSIKAHQEGFRIAMVSELRYQTPLAERSILEAPAR
ncbi:MAG: hypothetical protein VX278_01955 [Myxococcota bacterium]|nr:hypothetical protein [Myxococcota bacterium]